MIYNLPRAKKKGETWVIKQMPDLPYDSITIKIPFESNSTNFQKLKCMDLLFLFPVYIMMQLKFGIPAIGLTKLTEPSPSPLLQPATYSLGFKPMQLNNKYNSISLSARCPFFYQVS